MPAFPQPSNRLVAWGGACLAGFVFVSCDQPAAPVDQVEVDDPSDPVALEVGERKVHLAELQGQLELLEAKRSPSASNLEAFIESHVERMTMLETARKMGLEDDPELQRQWENLLIGKLKQGEMEKKLAEIEVTEPEVIAYFEENREDYVRPAQMKVALLFLGVPEKADEEKRDALLGRMEEARSKSQDLDSDVHGFGKLAMNYSEEATSRFKGGDIGWIQHGMSRSRWPDAVVEAAFALPTNGDFSEVITEPEGFYLLRRMDYRDEVVRPLEGRFLATLENALLGKKRAALQKELQQSWLTSEPVTIHDEVVAQLEFDSNAKPPAKAEDFPTPD